MSKPLPETLEERLDLALEVVTAPQKQRLLRYIFENPKKFSHEIAQACAVGYISARLWELNHDVLPQFGLYARCHAPEKWLTNRFGQTSMVHQWELVMRSVPAQNTASESLPADMICSAPTAMRSVG